LTLIIAAASAIAYILLIYYAAADARASAATFQPIIDTTLILH
jgi:hypothetical protein